MNCPGGILVYQSTLHSYRDLPIRCAELGLVHRHEKSGTLHGLFRVRAFTQDDAHIYMRRDQVQDEIVGVIDLVDSFYRAFGFPYRVELSTKPENAIGPDDIWDLATDALRGAREAAGSTTGSMRAMEPLRSEDRHLRIASGGRGSAARFSSTSSCLSGLISRMSER